MEAMNNKGVNLHLDIDKGTVSITGLLADTMVYLYDSHGKLKAKSQYILSSLVFALSEYGVYVLVMSHPNCQPEVRRLVYRG